MATFAPARIANAGEPLASIFTSGTALRARAAAANKENRDPRVGRAGAGAGGAAAGPANESGASGPVRKAAAVPRAGVTKTARARRPLADRTNEFPGFVHMRRTVLPLTELWTPHRTFESVPGLLGAAAAAAAAPLAPAVFRE